MSNLNIALLQMTSCGADRAANLAKGEEFCCRAAAGGADIALFPEMWSAGYGWEPVIGYHEEGHYTDDDWRSKAIVRDDPFVTHFRDLARELNMAIALTYLEKWEPLPRNSVSIIDRHGELLMTYAKVHTCDFSEECHFTPGDDFYVCDLDTKLGPVKVGAMICYDREFPESARILMLKGAEIILTPNACDIEINRLAQFRTRAYENMVGVALANYAAPQNNGHSVAYDGIAFTGGTEEVDGTSRDMLIIEAGEVEGIYVAPFDLDKLRAYRCAETWGNSYRKPRVYGPLVSPEVVTPFVRPDSRR